MNRKIVFKVIYWIIYSIILPIISALSIIIAIYAIHGLILQIIIIMVILFTLFILFWLFVNKMILKIEKIFTITYFIIVFCVSITITIGVGYFLNDYRNNQEWISDQITILDKNDEYNLILIKRIFGFADKVEIIELYNCNNVKEIKNNNLIISEIISEKDSTKSGEIDFINKEIIIKLNSNNIIVLNYFDFLKKKINHKL